MYMATQICCMNIKSCHTDKMPQKGLNKIISSQNSQYEKFSEAELYLVCAYPVILNRASIYSNTEGLCTKT